MIMDAVADEDATLRLIAVTLDEFMQNNGLARGYSMDGIKILEKSSSTEDDLQFVTGNSRNGV